MLTVPRYAYTYYYLLYYCTIVFFCVDSVVTFMLLMKARTMT